MKMTETFKTPLQLGRIYQNDNQFRVL